VSEQTEFRIVRMYEPKKGFVWVLQCGYWQKAWKPKASIHSRSYRHFMVNWSLKYFVRAEAKIAMTRAKKEENKRKGENVDQAVENR
jgi:hypothetical protein